MGQSKSQEHKPPADSASASLSRAHASGVQATTRAPYSLSSGITAPDQAREHARVHTSIEAPRAPGAPGPGPRGPARAHSGVGQGRGSVHDSAGNRDTAMMAPAYPQQGRQPTDARPQDFRPCRRGMECAWAGCRFQHPVGWNPQPQTNHRPPNPFQAGQSGGVRPQEVRQDARNCRKGLECFRADCKFQHPVGWNPRLQTTLRTTHPSQAGQSDSVRPQEVRQEARDCRRGLECSRADCRFQHPEGWSPQTQGNSSLQCRNGLACTNPACVYGHPSGWVRPRENQALCVVKSHPLGKSLYNKMTSPGYYGDNLEKLTSQVGADVTYLEGECRLRAQVPYAKAPEAQQCINKAIDESRPRLARENNELNIVGTTRAVLGRGGEVQCVLTGRDICTIEAIEVPMPHGEISQEDVQVAKDIMSRFLSQAETSGPRLSVYPVYWKVNNVPMGKIRISFTNPQDAQNALNAYPRGPWKRLKPFIQHPRTGTFVQIMELKIVYPLTARLRRDRQVVIREQLAPFGVRMQDIEISKGDRETKTGTATIHMETKSFADAALLHLLTYARRSNELASKPGELDVSLHTGFRLTVPGKQYRALEKKLLSLKSKHASVAICITAPLQQDRGFATIGLTMEDKRSQTQREALIRARRDIEAVLMGVVVPVLRETMQALPAEFKSQIQMVEEDLDGQVAISVEIESSRIRLFSSTSLEERPGFNQINPMKAAWDTIHNLIDSYRGEQPSHLEIAPDVRRWLLRGLPDTMPALRDALQRQLGDAAGVKVESAMEQENGSAEVKLVGFPAANLEATKLFNDLQSAAKSTFFSEQVDASRPAPGMTCALCYGDIKPSERHLMEPCLHAYHKECAKSTIINAIENRKLPVMCVDPGCTPQHVCLEDIKLLLGDDDKIETLCTRALMQHVNQNPGLGRCPTVDCKQVFKSNIIKFDCNRCLEVYCTQCNGMPRWHEGKTCEEFQELISTNNRSEEWVAQNTRRCGNCRAPFFKLDGCNHLKCGSCRKDLCNLCGETFPNATDTYRHLTATHGGYFTTA